MAIMWDVEEGGLGGETSPYQSEASKKIVAFWRVAAKILRTNAGSTWLQ